MMAGLQIPCPQCGKTLKLPDRSLLGRKGKCPKCRHAFVMVEPSDAVNDEPETESLDVNELYDELHQIEQRRLSGDPDEVQMEIAEPGRGQAAAGTGARWVPDASPNAEFAPAPPAPAAVPPGYPYPVPMQPQMPMAPQQWAVPPGYAIPPGYVVAYPPQPGMPYPVAPGYAPMPYGMPQYAAPPMMVPPPAAPPPVAPVANDNPFAVFGATEASPSALPSESEMLAERSRTPSKAKSKAKSKKNQKAKQTQLVAIIAVGLLVVGGIAFATLGGRSGATGKAKNKVVAQNTEPTDEGSGVEAPRWESPLPVSPTKGDPITLVCMPYGVSAVVHLRPAELWAKNPKREEFRFCFGPLGEWLEAQIKALCNHDPAAIEELTIGLIPGVVSEPMQVCGVVRLKQAGQKTELIKVFREMNAELKETDGDYPVYESDKYAYVIKDLQTFAFCPRAKQSEMVEAINRPNAQGPGMEALIKKTDRQRQIVIMFDPTTMAAHAQFILPPELHRVADRAVEFFEPKQIESVAWSVHVTDGKFHSEILARNRSSVAKTTLQTDLSKRLDKLPRDLQEAIRGYMDPKQVGPREIIGRFPIMTKVFAMSTHGTSGDRYASLTTSLPVNAAPNLAIGALLTWDESTRTDFNKASSNTTPKETATKLPDLVADRLKQIKCEIEFEREPLQGYIKFVADECKVTIDIDGDALKAAGYTKNMPQKFSLGKVTGLEALGAILKKYQTEKVPMALVIDEGKKVAILTTKDFAEKDNLKVYPVP